MKRFASTLYLPLRRNSTSHEYEPDPEGFLFAKGVFQTKIRAEDLPEWYVYGRVFNQDGYISAKGVKHLLYKPKYTTKHIHKDDLLFISYDKPIEPDENGTHDIWFHGYDHIVCGHLIIDFLEAAKIYSGYDIKPIMRSVRKKERWYKENHGK